MEETLKELTKLFFDSKSKSEFNFVTTLLNFKMMGDPKLTSNLYEWFDAMEFYIGLYETLKENKERTRIGLLFYSTFQENSDFYNIIGSFCNILLGLKPSSYLFWKTKKNERYLGIAEKQNFLLEKLYEINCQNLINFFNNNIYSSIRNSFFHSTYSLSETNIFLNETEPVIINGNVKHSLDLECELFPIIENVKIFFLEFKKLFYLNLKSYNSNKDILADLPIAKRVTILGDNDGLLGFKIENAVQFYGEYHDAGVLYNKKKDIFEAFNMRFNFPTEDTIIIREQINRYINKDDIHQSDVEFQNLVDKIVDRKQSEEIRIITQLLIKFGDIRYEKMMIEENFYKKKSFIKHIIPFYERAIKVGKNVVDLSIVVEKLNYLKGEYNPR